MAFVLRIALTAFVALGFAVPGQVYAQRWTDATARCMGTTAQWSSKIELADLDHDGNIDILVPNGGDYDTPGAPEPTRVWQNLGDWATPGVRCTEISAQAVGGFTGLSRAIRVADVDGDGDLDIVTGGAYQTQLTLYLRDGTGWTDATAQLPQQLTSVGDMQFGDVDGDGDLDLVIADWGTLSPGDANYVGGRTRLYLNDGTGHFTEATATQMPDILVGWSWDLQLVDVDNDWDLDILVSCKLCASSYLFRNDGTGHFTNDPDALPHYGNNYAFAVMDIDGDGDLDLATINDGPSSTDHLFVNDGTGKFTDETSTRLTGTANPPADDNAAVWLDVDSDGDADLLVASLSGPDRLLLNDGTGHFTLSPNATPNDTPGSLGIAVGDIDGDGRLDVVQAQGEVAFPEKLQLGSTLVAIDTAPPVISGVSPADQTSSFVSARVHDHQSPSRAHDWQRVWLERTTAAGPDEIDMTWYGEYLWRAPLESGVASYRVCAKDRQGNQACSDPVDVTGPLLPDGTIAGDAQCNSRLCGPKASGGCCEAGQSPASPLALLGVVLALSARSRSRRRRSCSATPDPR